MRARRIIEGAGGKFVYLVPKKGEKFVRAEDIKSKYQHLRQYLNRFMIMRHRKFFKKTWQSFVGELCSASDERLKRNFLRRLIETDDKPQGIREPWVSTP